jgi:hypothetical protein
MLPNPTSPPKPIRILLAFAGSWTIGGLVLYINTPFVSGMGLNTFSRTINQLIPLALSFFCTRSTRFLPRKFWYMEVIIPYAFDSQKSVIVYSSLVISPHSPEAHFLTPVALSDINNFFLFQHSTLYLELRISDEPFSSSRVPTGSESSLPRVPLPVSYAGLQNIGWGSYVNGVVQALFHLPIFRGVVYSLTDAAGVVRELQRLFGGPEIPAKAFSSTRLLLGAFGWSQTDVLLRHDSGDFVRLLLSKLTETAEDQRVLDLFAVKFMTLPPQLGLSLDIRQAGSVDEALARSLAPAEVAQFLFNFDFASPTI